MRFDIDSFRETADSLTENLDSELLGFITDYTAKIRAVYEANREELEQAEFTLNGRTYYAAGAPMPTVGWAVVSIIGMTLRVLTLRGFLWLLGGGICYTVGAVFYGLGKKRRYMHGVFHLFVNAGSLLQAIAILKYVL